MTLCNIDREIEIAKRYAPLGDEALHILEAAYVKLLSTQEYSTFGEQIKSFWKLFDVAKEGYGHNPDPAQIKPDATFASYFSKTEFILRCYRPLSQHLRDPVYNIFRGGNPETTTAGRIVAEIDNALDEYRAICGRSENPEDLRRYRIIRAIYIEPSYIQRKEIMKIEEISDATATYDVIIATARLTAVLFKTDFPNHLTPSNLRRHKGAAWIGRSGNQRHFAYSVF